MGFIFKSFFLCVALFTVHVIAIQQKEVSITLRAGWASTSYFLEAAEFLAEENADLFFAFFKDWKANTAEKSDDECWNKVIKHTTSYLKNSLSQILPVVLSSRQYSPKLELYRQLAQQLHEDKMDSCAWVNLDGAVYSSADQLRAALKSKQGSKQKTQLFAFDHMLNASLSANASSVAVLYGMPTTTLFNELLKELRTAATAAAKKRTSLAVAVRPLLLSSCQVGPCEALGSGGSLVLPGYGVEAAIKNMEYSAMDDKKKVELSEVASDTEGALGDVKGFKLDVLLERKPALRQELLTFRDHLLSGDEETLKVWDLKDVGLQASQRILAAQDPLALMADISQNFPSLVSSLSRQPLNNTLKVDLASNGHFLSAGSNFMLVNGLAVDVTNFDFYKFVERIRIEARLVDSLRSMGLGPEGVKAVLKTRALDTSAGGSSSGGSGSSADDTRLDLGSMEHVTFLNDLEKDNMYARFSSNIYDILNVFPGRLRPLAKNVFTLVFISDPISREGFTLAQMIGQMYAEFYPVRFGLVMRIPEVLERLAIMKRYPFLATPVPTWEEMSTSERFARAFLTIQEAFGPSAAFDFWQTMAMSQSNDFDLEVQQQLSVEDAFTRMWAAAAAHPQGTRARNAAKKDPNTALEMLQTGSSYAAEAGMKLVEMTTWLSSKGLASSGGAPVTMWLNGQVTQLNAIQEGYFEQELMYMVMMEMQRVQEHVYLGRISDSEPVLKSLLRLSNSIKRWNPAIIGSGRDEEDGSLGSSATPATGVWDQISAAIHDPLWPKLSKAALHTTDTDPEDLNISLPTFIVVLDVASSTGRELLGAAASYLLDVQDSSAVSPRVLVVFNPQDEDSPLCMLDMVLQEVLYRNYPQVEAAKFLKKLLSDVALSARLVEPILQAGRDQTNTISAFADEVGLPGKKLVDNIAHALMDAITDFSHTFKMNHSSAVFRYKHAKLATQALKLPPGASALITSCRQLVVHTPTPSGSSVAEQGGVHEDEGVLELTADDFQLLHSVCGKKHGGDAVSEAVLTAVKEDTSGTVSPYDLILGASSLLAAQKYPESRLAPTLSRQIGNVLGSMKSASVISADPGASGITIHAIINPLSRAAQRISQVLQFLRSTMAPAITLYLNPVRDLSDMPLKSYYRFSLPEVKDAKSKLPGAPAATFASLPLKKLLEIHLEVPEAWLVSAAYAPVDLDNMRLADVPHRTVHAEYELDSILITGSCVDVTTGRQATARGLQLYLGTRTQSHIVDTLVMSNLAYFQLKANPGYWLLSLAPGRSREIYSLVSSTGISDTEATGGVGVEEANGERMSQVAISSFTGRHMVLRVRKRPGMEKEDVLKDERDGSTEEESDDESMWGMLGSLFKTKEATKKIAPAPALSSDGRQILNIFTVASGHMYERLQKIMFLSVVKNTEARVKFWIISNYISPHHREVLPALAAEYQFDYEFVTYKWPHWLHKQTEKQRIIWAYKILFLDVLFPLDVDRIIFVDSDQIVRTDLLELFNMDINGAALAYTPFCTSNAEMDEYRFWTGGFWRDHLQGKPYHISALYLVDLRRFRQLAAGDQYRVIYEQLSRDPNSLANLDQDLPNYAQHNIPLFSLPQEWLWCETWCSNETKTQARTIDLCNNPKTKEPKLQQARRIVSEWESLDAEQAAVTARVEAVLAGGSWDPAAPAVETVPDAETETETEKEATSSADDAPSVDHDASEL